MTTYISPLFATGQAVDAALTKGLHSVQEGDSRLTDARTPLPHTHPITQVVHTEYMAGNMSPTITLSTVNGEFQSAYLNGNSVVSIESPPAGQAARITFRYKVTSTAPATITWPTNFRWAQTPVIAVDPGTEGFIEMNYTSSGWVARAFSPGQTDWTVIKALPQLVGYWDLLVSPKTQPGNVASDAPGAPIGFLPNAANSSALGPNIITGTPTWVDSDPTIASISQSGGEVTLTSLKASAAAAYANLSSSPPPTMIGGTYEFSVEITQLPAGAVVYIGAVDGGWVDALSLKMVSSAGVSAIRFVAKTVSSIPFVGMAPSSVGQVLSFKDATCKLASTKDASQTTTANKPILRQTSTTKQFWLDADSTDALNITLASQLTNAAIFRVTAEGVTVARGQTVATTYNLITPYAYNGPVAIFDESSTALTTEQVAQITRYMGASVPTLGVEEVPDGTFSSGSTTGWTAQTGATISVSSGKLNVLKTTTGQNWGVARLTAALAADTPYLFKFTGSAGAYPQGFWRLISETFSGQKGAETFAAGSLSKVAVSYPAGYPSHFDFGVSDVNANASFNYDDVSVRAIL